jgi:NAD(P)-dependent dehydrogenase (short-subunit alcohol dehydrogenase family)
MQPFILIAPASRGLSLALTRHYLQTTNLPVFASHRDVSDDDMRAKVLSSLPHVDPTRLNLLRVELTSEDSIASAAEQLKQTLQTENYLGSDAYIDTAFFAGGVLLPERQPSDLDADAIRHTFDVNVVAHLLCIKHFSQFLPGPKADIPKPSKWVHVSARVGSVSDNRLGGWYSYRASKAALNQVVRTFDLHLQRKKTPGICVGVHPGTVKTDFSREFWGGVPKDKLFEPEHAAKLLANVVSELKTEQRGRIWDWAGKEVMP